MLGERLSIALACLVDAAIMVVVYLAGSVPVLALAVFIHGTTGSIFGLARQTYITDAIPLRYRARGMSSLGGVLRIGYFIGPLAGVERLIHRIVLVIIELCYGRLIRVIPGRSTSR